MTGKVRLKHYSIRTEQVHVDWISPFIVFLDGRHPDQLGAQHVEEALTLLAVEGCVAASTQNQAKSALLFLYREVLGIELPWLDNVEQARAPKRLPVVLTREEIQTVLSRLEGTHALIVGLLYGAGLRIMEAVRLRVKDVEFTRREILVRDGKGFKDRVTMLPGLLAPSLVDHLARVRALHESDLAAGGGAVYLPYALEIKYPNAAREWAWQYVFPGVTAENRSACRRNATTSRDGSGHSARGKAGGARCRYCEASVSSHLASQFRDALAAIRL